MRRAALLIALVAFLLAAAPAAGAERVTRAEAIAAADQDPKVVEQEREHGELGPTASLDDDKANWEVAYFDGGEERVLVLVDAHSGEVTESWTGYQVAWKMARGYSGAFGHKLNAPYVFLPLCLLFLVGLADWRRLWRVANLDLLFLLGFGVSHYFFNRAEIGVSVPLVYPVLVYLLGRSLWIGLRGRGDGIRPVWPVAWMVIAALFLMGFRVGLNVADSGAIDVGYAGVVGANRIAHGEPIYDNFPDDVSSGDTYGPVNYLAYLPFERIWPWSGEWDDLPAAHAASILFDLACFTFLILLGIRIRPGPEGQRLAATLAFAWAAYPYTAYALESNSNDSLVAALLLATLLLAARPLARGALLAAATWSKFVAAPLAPMYLTYQRKLRPALLFVAGFAAVTIAVLLWPALDPGLKTFYDRTIATQAGRDSPFSLWGQTSLEPLRITILALTALVSIAFAFIPKRKSLVQLAALSAALLVALQLTLHHWFYLYIVWFYPLFLVAATAVEKGTGTPSERLVLLGQKQPRTAAAAPPEQVE
ncbi:MAG TPA: PepSY domain-containing protein [Solirubrobacterales bacterium]|nr:PepSY domain-containing protein [Solirubrobacterales bacterium]